MKLSWTYKMDIELDVSLWIDYRLEFDWNSAQNQTILVHIQLSEDLRMVT